jgi:NADP-dependent 3-hydroxy acid dehydrogenase YdfG
MKKPVDKRLFNQQVVWITGATSGIGRALAREFAGQGATVAISGRRAGRLDEVVAELAQFDATCLAVPCDVTDDRAVAEAVQHIGATLGSMDVAVANAGLAITGKFEDLGDAEWRRQLDVNVLGAVSTARHALPALRQRKGRLALVGSVAGFVCLARSSAYCASKFAIRAIGATLSQELHGSGVSCTTIHPGFVDSEIAQVDNQGVFRPEREDRRPRNLIWSAEQAARVMVRAIYRRRREYVFTGHGKLGAWMGQHMPGLVHMALTRKSV